MKTQAPATPVSPAPSPAINFDQFEFSPEMTKAILEMGFDSPTPIQQETLPILLGKPTDFLGLAATGTGKTAAFAIPLLEKLTAGAKGVQALILCPTRELAKQTSEQINLLARFKKTKAIAIYGGSDYAGQLRALRDGVAIVVGTPGRIIDHLDRKTLVLDHLQTVVLDEADEMISMGFKEEIEYILEKVNQEEKHQTWLFSATMSKDIRKIADQFLDKPKQIQINKTEGVTTAVKQYFYQVREDEKPEVVRKLIDQAPGFYGLIFCQTKLLVTDLTQSLKANGYLADCLHGDMEQNARERTMKAFKARQVNVLVCTDVASRGLDVKDLTHVINYSLPRELDLYVHRVGRTGRGGKEGLALSLVTPSHNGLISKIERATNSRMTRATIPNDADLLQIKISKALADFIAPAPEGSIGFGKVKEMISTADWKKAIEHMDKEEIIARFLAKNLKVPAKKAATDSESPRDRDRDAGRRGGGREYGRGGGGSNFRGGGRGFSSGFGSGGRDRFDRAEGGISTRPPRGREKKRDRDYGNETSQAVKPAPGTKPPLPPGIRPLSTPKPVSTNPKPYAGKPLAAVAKGIRFKER